MSAALLWWCLSDMNMTIDVLECFDNSENKENLGRGEIAIVTPTLMLNEL